MIITSFYGRKSVHPMKPLLLGTTNDFLSISYKEQENCFLAPEHVIAILLGTT